MHSKPFLRGVLRHSAPELLTIVTDGASLAGNKALHKVSLKFGVCVFAFEM